ncbi:hypothetical protein ACIBI9_51935 [Nonomuraea sp. NPDC050451]|uniref:hypothetical protein n=1 Tax=Nonomuraea sp. NPDC050451 TaxID=3364364 RepID=UPI0037B51214
MRDERDLVRTLRAAAVQVEHRDLADGVAHRRRARRTKQRVRVLLAAAAVVAVVAGTAAVVSRSDDHRRAEPATVLHGWDSIKSAAELWPQAVVKVPAYDSEGWRTQVATSMGATEVLLLAKSKKARRLEVYDSARGTIRILGSVPEAQDLRYVAVGTQYIAWYTGPVLGGPIAFWIMPRAGGAARRVGEAAHDIESFGITEDVLVWSVREGGGVYRMPVTGGTPQLLPGTAGLRLTYWPWAAGMSSRGVQNRVVNLETGESIEVSVPDGVGVMQCHPEWCAGGRGERVIVQRVDGSERHTLPQELGHMGSSRMGLLGDRYAIFRALDEPMKRGVPLAIVYDFETGVIAKLGERPYAAGDGMVGYGYSTSPSTTRFWWTGDKVEDAKEYIVLNVAAMPR